MIQDVYEHLAYFYQIGVGSGCGKTFEFDIDKFCITYKFFPTKVDSALRILERSGYLHYEDDPDGKARVMFLLGRNELYILDQLPPTQEAVITALLRSYGSLFVDLTFIDEHLDCPPGGIKHPAGIFCIKEPGSPPHHQIHPPPQDTFHQLYTRPSRWQQGTDSARGMGRPKRAIYEAYSKHAAICQK